MTPARYLIVVLSNHASVDAQALALRVAEVYLAGKLAEPAAKAPGTTAAGTVAAVEPYTPTANDLLAYAGVYDSQELDVPYRLVVDDGTLVAQVPRHADLKLKPIQRDHYAGFPLEMIREDIRFRRDAAGRVTGFRVSLLGVRNLRFDRRD
jgi:hypothetical protein